MLMLEPSRTNILIVSPDHDARDQARRLLEDWGFTVLTANSRREALEQLVELRMPLHLLITELATPQVNGFDLTRVLRLVNPRLPALFVSPSPERPSARAQIVGGRNGFLRKPFTSQALLFAVRELLGF